MPDSDEVSQVIAAIPGEDVVEAVAVSLKETKDALSRTLWKTELGLANYRTMARAAIDAAFTQKEEET